MSHALADVVHPEQFHAVATFEGIMLACPVCEWDALADRTFIGALLDPIRAHIAEAHTAVPPSVADAVLHAAVSGRKARRRAGVDVPDLLRPLPALRRPRGHDRAPARHPPRPLRRRSAALARRLDRGRGPHAGARRLRGRAVITDHVFRVAPHNGTRDARRGSAGGTTVRPGSCLWLGTCGRPRSEHISVDRFRARRGAR